jgi:hypothetical protein
MATLRECNEYRQNSVCSHGSVFEYKQSIQYQNLCNAGDRNLAYVGRASPRAHTTEDFLRKDLTDEQLLWAYRAFHHGVGQLSFQYLGLNSINFSVF